MERTIQACSGKKIEVKQGQTTTVVDVEGGQAADSFVRVRFYDEADDQKLRFAVIVTKTDGHWVFCKHKERNTLEVPGGHREPGEDILTTAKRELQEETGAIDFSIRPVCVYSVTAPWNFDGQETFGMLFFADVKAFEKELHSEIERIVIQDGPPSAWTYPDIQPYLMEEVQKWMRMEGIPE